MSDIFCCLFIIGSCNKQTISLMSIVLTNIKVVHVSLNILVVACQVICKLPTISVVEVYVYVYHSI